MCFVWGLQILTFGGLDFLCKWLTNPNVRELVFLRLGGKFFTFSFYKSLRSRVEFHTFGSYKFLRLGARNRYVWGLDFIRLGVTNSYVWVLDINVWGLQIVTFRG